MSCGEVNGCAHLLTLSALSPSLSFHGIIAIINPALTFKVRNKEHQQCLSKNPFPPTQKRVGMENIKNTKPLCSPKPHVPSAHLSFYCKPLLPFQTMLKLSF